MDQGPETLRTCPACGGEGYEERQAGGPGMYSKVPCFCCRGLGTISRKRDIAYRRWRRIVHKK